MEELEVRPGDLIAAKYRVEKVLGAGGMGIVVSARHVALGNVVAIKLMQPRAVQVKGAVERFLREGQAAAQLHSKHVTKVIDVGQLDSGAPYMIMEHLAGRDLSVVIEQSGAVALPDAAEYLLQACDAIGEAHSKGIVHRDLKPANLFLQMEPDGAPLIKVLDFGIAKMSGGEQGLTGTSQGMGSGGYMSPEQMSSAKKVDHRADIWALGVTFYELLTAHRPFEADSLEQFVTRVFWEQPTPLETYRPDLPRELSAIVLRCLEKQPDARFSSVAHFAQLIAPYAHPRARSYVGRIAQMLGVGAPSLSQTNPGMTAPAAGATPGTVSTAFGPAPAVAVAVAAPMPGTGPAPAAPAYGNASASGPYPQAAPPTGPQPPVPAYAPANALSASSSGPHPFAGVDARVSTVPASAPMIPPGAFPSSGPMGSTDLTGERAQPAPPKKAPVALFVAGGALLLALGGGGVWLAMRPSPADGGNGTATTTTSSAGDTSASSSARPDAPTAPSATADTPPRAPDAPTPASATASAAIPSGTPAAKPATPIKPSAKPVPDTKPTATAAVTAASTVKAVPTVGDKRN